MVTVNVVTFTDIQQWKLAVNTPINWKFAIND